MDVVYPITTQNTIPAEIYPVVVKRVTELKATEEVLVQKFKIFNNKVPTLTTIEHFESTNFITFTYDISSKHFVAVLKYDKITDKVEIIEVNPMIVKPVVKFDQTITHGKKITTSTSVEEVIKVNKDTVKVIENVKTEYPLLKGY